MSTNLPMRTSLVALMLVLILIGFARILASTPKRVLKPGVMFHERAPHTTNPLISSRNE